MKEAILEPILRKMRLNKILPHLNEFNNPRVLDIGCGWEARLLREIEPFISLGVGIDFKAPNIKTDKLNIFPYYFEKKIDSIAHSANMTIGGGGRMIYIISIMNLAKILCIYHLKTNHLR